MRIEALKQPYAFDITAWDPDARFAVYPQGARPKSAFFAPEGSHEVLVSGKRYMFKRSKKSYPDQFWCEIVAYRIGCLMGVEVPPTFVATNEDTGQSGALIEWFYEPRDLWIYAGEFLQRMRPDFDRSKGGTHNVVENTRLLKALEKSKQLHWRTNWRQWWVDALLFDSLIGNTDRHQDNWGFVLTNVPDGGGTDWRLSPLFDNGTSLGHERFPNLVANWGERQFDQYVSRGTHHARWSLQGEPLKGHFELVAKALATWPDEVQHARSRLNFDPSEMAIELQDLLALQAIPPLSEDRFKLMLRLLQERFQKLQHLLDDHA